MREGRDMSEEGELTEITVRISKDQHARLWKAKIFARIKIEELVQKALDGEFRKMNL